ncbi:unannotated protein [freshwater metagenome]|uniref:Unannotated protein n=1 Tax=freshwater metagenome TaxID=449393 RepID=A0A6J7GUN6_9ZZZZ
MKAIRLVVIIAVGVAAVVVVQKAIAVVPTKEAAKDHETLVLVLSQLAIQ